MPPRASTPILYIATPPPNPITTNGRTVTSIKGIQLMDRDSNTNRSTTAEDENSPSSIYSNISEKKWTFPVDRRDGSRATSATYTPSFMSHHATMSTERLGTPTSQLNGQQVSGQPINIPMRPPFEAPDRASDLASPSTMPGVLLVIFVADIPSTILSHLGVLLKLQLYSSIAIAATSAQHTLATQLKMDVYALIGRMGKEMGVMLYTRDEADALDVAEIVRNITASGQSLQGVVCFPAFGTAIAAERDILAVSEAKLQQSWDRGPAFVHAAMRASVDSLLSRCTEGVTTKRISARAPHGPVFLVAGSPDSSPAAQICKAACDQLLSQLETTTISKGLTVGYAEAMLKGEPTADTTVQKSLLQPGSPATHGQEQAFTPSESPTKLWNMWALRDGMDLAAD